MGVPFFLGWGWCVKNSLWNDAFWMSVLARHLFYILGHIIYICWIKMANFLWNSLRISSNFSLYNHLYSSHFLYRKIVFLVGISFYPCSYFPGFFLLFSFFQGACLLSSCKHAVQFTFCKGYHCWSPMRAGVRTFSGFELLY